MAGGRMTQAFWNEMYRCEGYRYGTAPNAFLAAQAALLPAGSRVLCVGDGEGRNGVWLAQQGYDVVTVDPSGVGVDKARELARDRGVTLDLRQGLFPEVGGDAGPFDAVVLSYVHVPPAARPGLHQAAVDVLAPGGTVILEAFTPDQLGRDSGGPKKEEMLYTAEQLAADFDGLRIDLLIETETTLDEGHGHAGLAAVVRLVGVRTAS